MKVNQSPLSGLLVIEPVVHQDERGFFLETYQQSRYQSLGILDEFRQDNQSRSSKGVLRGLHFQVKHPQSQIITVLSGKIFDVGVDLRPSSATFGKWFGAELSETGFRQIYMEPGFAHGFCVLSEWADIHYKTSGKYDPSDEGGIIWNDIDININWPIKSPFICPRDLRFPSFENFTHEQLSKNQNKHDKSIL